jgi:hypothetical protein
VKENLPGGPALRREGIALITAVLIMMILMALGTVFIAVMNTDLKIAVNQRKSLQAFYITETGIQRALLTLAGDINNWNKVLRGEDEIGGTGDDGILFSNEPFGEGTYTVRVVDDDDGDGDCYTDTNDVVVVTARGNFQGANRVIKIKAERSIPAPFDYVFFAGAYDEDSPKLKAIKIKGKKKKEGGTVIGDVHSNASIETEEGTTVTGDARAVGSVEKIKGTVTGTITGDDPNLYIPIPEFDFGYYRDISTSGGTYFESKENFQEYVETQQDPETGNYNLEGVFFVEDDIDINLKKLEGGESAPTLTIKGTLIAYNIDKDDKGGIKIRGKGGAYVHQPSANYPTYPALMATSGIEIKGESGDEELESIEIRGLIYNAGYYASDGEGGKKPGKGKENAAVKIKTKKDGSVYIKGLIISPIIESSHNFLIEYERPNPPLDSLSEAEIVVRVDSWREVY